MLDIRNFTSKPTVVFNFRAPRQYPETVWWWLKVNARGKILCSDVMDSTSAMWPSPQYSKLSTLAEAYDSAASVSNKLWAARLPDPTIEMQRRYPKLCGFSSLALLNERVAVSKRFSATFEPAYAETKRLYAELASFSAMMASPPPFTEWVAAGARQLKVAADDTDERSYALYRGSVWSCSRGLEVGQWQLLVDRIITSEEAQLASALAEESGTSQGRERISPEVRRAVWTRDQGKCARCGNRERLEFDHIVPVSRGGSNTERNIELLCEVCNRAKSDSIM